MSPKLPLGSLNLLVIWRAKPKIHNVRYTKTNGALWKEKPTQKWKHKKVQKLYIHKSEISACNHREEEMEGGPEQERESSPISVFSPPGLQIVHTLGSWLGFCVKVLGFFIGKTFFFSFSWGWWCIFISSFRGCLWPIFRWEEGFGPFRCYFYDLVYYVLCLGKGLVVFCMILETKLFPLHSCCLWSL